MSFFQQGAFQIDPNATPEQLARKRAMMAAMMPQFGRAKYVGEGVGQALTGLAMGLKGRQLDKFEAEKRKDATDSLAGLTIGGGAYGTQAGQPSYSPFVPRDTGPKTEAEQIAGDAMVALGKDPASQIRKGLIERGLPEHVADGFLMNFKDESGLKTDINEQAPIVPGSRGGYGLAQWTGPRRKQLEAFASARGKPVSDLDTQLDFLMMELQGPESSAAKSIFSTQDSGSAAAAIVNDFLRPAEEHRSRRVAEYTGGGGAPTGPSVTDLQAALANPWLTQPQRQQIQGMISAQQQQQQAMRDRQWRREDAVFDQQLSQQDPMYQAKLAKLQNPIKFSQVKGSDLGLTGPQADMMFNVGPDGKVTQIGGGGTNISVNTGGNNPGLGKLSTDYGYVLDPETGQPVVDPETGLPRAAPVPGSKADQEIAESAEQGQAKQNAAMTASDVITSAASRAREAYNSQDFGHSLGGIASWAPWTDSAELYRQNDVLKANATIENLNQMRRQSPTGGALGNVTEGEGRMLANKAGALDPRSPTYLRDLEDYERTLLRTVHGWEEGERIFEMTRSEKDAESRGQKKTGQATKGSFEEFAADPSAQAAAKKYGVTLEEMWKIKQGGQ